MRATIMMSLSLAALMIVSFLACGDALPRVSRVSAFENLLKTYLEDRKIPSKRKATTAFYGGTRWHNKLVYYKVIGFNGKEKGLIQSSIEEWEKNTCLKFVKLGENESENFIAFQGGNLSAGCYSDLGMVGGQQNISLGAGCRNKPTIMHEIGHAIGFEHEHSRPDRDDYITVNLENVDEDDWYNVEKLTECEVDTMGIPYDYGSIMQYDQYSFSSNGKPSIVPKDTRWTNFMGQMTSLSFLDNKLANEFYECAAYCGDVNCDEYPDAYLDESCTCRCRGWPIKTCGNYSPDGPGYECANVDKDCEAMANGGQCTIEPFFMIQNCKKACNLCGQLADLGPPGSCVDLSLMCRWVSEEDCQDQVTKPRETWITEDCLLTCNYCCAEPYNCTTLLPPPTPCRDLERDCDRLAAEGLCTATQDDREWMQWYCPISCEMC